MFEGLSETQIQEIIKGMEAMPSGDLISWLKTQLSLEDLYYACMYILDSAISQVFLIAPAEEQIKLNDFLDKNQFNSFFSHISNMLNQDKTDSAALFLARFIDGWNLGFEVMVDKFKLNLDS